MNILILEDNEEKRARIESLLKSLSINITDKYVENFSDFIVESTKKEFDLIVADLLVPVFKDSKAEENVANRLIDVLRQPDSCNYSTPVIAVTKFDELAEESFSELNKFDINVITYSAEKTDWEKAFKRKVEGCIPLPIYEFVIVCALEKEAQAFTNAEYTVGQEFTYEGLSCRDIQIANQMGIIVVPPRMGLVNAAIITARSIDLFKPKIICMSGICAGIEGSVDIYDVVIPDICHQHDSGKWTTNGFVTESYAVQLEHSMRTEISRVIKDPSFKKSITDNIVLTKHEFAPDSEKFDFKLHLAPGQDHELYLDINL